MLVISYIFFGIVFHSFTQFNYHYCKGINIFSTNRSFTIYFRICKTLLNYHNSQKLIFFITLQEKKTL